MDFISFPVDPQNCRVPTPAVGPTACVTLQDLRKNKKPDTNITS